MPACDQFWSEQNGACSDEFGNYIDGRTGESIQSWDLSRLLQGIQQAVTPKPAATPAPGAKPPAKNTPAFDLQVWFKTGYNLIYVALGFLALIFVFSMAGRRR